MQRTLKQFQMMLLILPDARNERTRRTFHPCLQAAIFRARLPLAFDGAAQHSGCVTLV